MSVFAYAKTKTQISFMVTAKLISAFVSATWMVQSLFLINPKFQASSHLLWQDSLVCVIPSQKPQRPVFSQGGSYNSFHFLSVFQSHSSQCPLTIVQCTSCQAQFPRQLTTRHMSECPKAKIKCQYTFLGCTFEVRICLYYKLEKC